MFTLHPQLEADTISVGTLTLSRVLLMNNALFPWVILVPERSDASEFNDLALSDRIVLMAEVSLISDSLTEMTGCDKINIAMLGNQVPQLHTHVVARFKNDSAWPAPVWGKGHQPYDALEAKQFANKLRKRLASAHEGFMPTLHEEV